MVMFKVFRGKGGGRDIRQVSTGEKVQPKKGGKRPRPTDYSEAIEPKADIELRRAEPELAEPEEEPLPVQEEAQEEEAGFEFPFRSTAFQQMSEILYEKGVKMLVPLVSELLNVEEVEILHAMERQHPKYEAGRVQVLNALEERKGEFGMRNPSLAAPAPAAPVTESPFGKVPEDTACPHCDFVAGSAFGLRSHVRAKHAE